VDLVRLFQDQIFGADSAEDDYRSYTPTQLLSFIEQMKNDPKRNDELYNRARYLYHQRWGTPFAVMTFALFGMVLGVQDPRRMKSMVYLSAIGTIIAGYVLLMGFKWLAEHGRMSAPLAAWLPNLILLALGGFLIFQRNRLPPSESMLAWENLPFYDRLVKAFRPPAKSSTT
jgi:lipopolysaccharide export LptBFGC system permease protein LptF